MIKLSDIFYCPKCGHKIIWEQILNSRTRDCTVYSMFVDTYKPELLEYDGKIVKLRFICKKCKNIEDINYDICTSRIL